MDSGKPHWMRRNPGLAWLCFAIATFASGVLTVGSPIVTVISTSAVALLTAIFIQEQLRRGFVWGWLAGLVLSLFGTSFYIALTYGTAQSYETADRNSELFDSISAYTIPGSVILCAIAGVCIYRHLISKDQNAT